MTELEWFRMRLPQVEAERDKWKARAENAEALVLTLCELAELDDPITLPVAEAVAEAIEMNQQAKHRRQRR